jgi:N-acyl-D-amino-acid deacylase
MSPFRILFSTSLLSKIPCRKRTVKTVRFPFVELGRNCPLQYILAEGIIKSTVLIMFIGGGLLKTLIYGGHVIDPANRVDAQLNILYEDGKILWVGREKPQADQIVDASGKIVAPGFVDIHMHEDKVDADGHIDHDIFLAMLQMGVTTAVGGNCGINVYDPVEYLSMVDRDGAPVNVAMFAGHEYFRKAAGAADIYGKATEAQRQEMEKNIRIALENGCVGVSFGLRYVPGADRDEFFRAAACCAESKKIISSHVRDDADGIFEAIDEFVEAGIQYDLPVQISHIGSMGGFGQMEDVLRQVDAYRMNGLDIAMDCYPYFAFSTKIGTPTYDPGWLERYHCDYDVLEFSEGKYKGQRATKETFDEIRRDFPECITVCHVMQEADIRMAFRHPNVMLASDGLLNQGQGHPRAAGSFPRFLAEFAKKGTISLYEAIHKMTAMPAQRLRLSNKGRLNAGADADITIFDYDTICDGATFAQPTLAPKGIDCVIIGGEIALKDGVIVKSSCGKAVRM